MGLWDDVKDSASNAIKKTAAATSNVVKQAKENYEENQRRRKWKYSMLDKFSFPQMKQLCHDYGDEPSPFEENDEGKRIRRKLDRDIYQDFAMDNVPSNYIKKFADEHRIDVPSFTEKETEKSTPDRPASHVVTKSIPTKETSPQHSEFEEILDAIKNDYEDTIRDQFFTDEDQFNDNLVSYLRAKFGDKHRIENTRKLHRDTGDIFVDGKYVFEQKFADKQGTLDKGITETKRYREKGYPGIAVIILDVGKISSSLLQYKRWYEEEGAKVIILRGKGERKKTKYKIFVEKR